MIKADPAAAQLDHNYRLEAEESSGIGNLTPKTHTGDSLTTPIRKPKIYNSEVAQGPKK